MATRRYLNFDLLLEQDGEGQFEARVTAAPVAGLPHVRFELPFDEKSLKIRLMELDLGRTDVRGVGGAGQQAAKDFGGPLFEAIFTGKLASAWTGSLDKVAAQEAGGLRLRLRVADEAVDLAGLPWELLYDAKRRAFPAQSEITPLVRFLDVAGEVEPIQVTGPLRVLAIISSPVDLPRLDVEREWAHIETAMAAKVREGLVVVDRLAEPTVDALGEWLRDHDTHVIHFVGHGDFDPVGGEGFVYFQNERTGADPVTAAVLGPFVYDHDPLRMVVINACRTARVGRTDPYGGMAQGLVLQGTTAVVAMQFPITDPAAVMFTGKFYGALAAGLPVDQAVSYARKALHAKFRSEWATPVLFMRSPDGNIFQDVQAPPGWVWHEPSEPEPTKPDEPDPVLVELGPTDLDVTDITGPFVGLPPGEGDPYDFLFERKRPEQDSVERERLERERLEQERLERERIRRERLRRALRMLAAAAAVLVVVIALVIGGRLFGDDLPAGEPLTDSQMLVAAGDGILQLDIYLIDTNDPAQKEKLTSDRQSWLPVLSPDRRSMIYFRRNTPTRASAGQLRTAAAIDGTGDRELELPPECRDNASRPAWIPGTEDLVLRCQEGDVVTLLRVGLDGDLDDVLLTVGTGEGSDLAGLGDPTVSGDGHTVVFWGRDGESELDDGGALYWLDLDSTSGTFEPVMLFDESAEMFGYSDAVFSRQEDGEEWLAWRIAEPGETAGGPTNYEVYAATFSDGVLGAQVQISDPSSGPREQDPMFSPDGKRIVYGTELDGTQRLWVASVAEPGDRRPFSAQDPPFWAVPAWSGR